MNSGFQVNWLVLGLGGGLVLPNSILLNPEWWFSRGFKGNLVVARLF